MRISTFLLLGVLLLSACASGLRTTKAPIPVARANSRTVVLFLVDGLSVKALQTAFRRGLMPHTRRFFLRGESKFALGRAAFPSLTYPNIASVLTTRPVGEHPVISNHMLAPNGKVLNFEAAKFHPLLRAEVDPISVIGEMKKEGRETASFSYIFGLNADSHMQVGLREGLEYTRHDYRDLDDRLVENFEDFLASRPDPATWPEFIYVHLVGVDGVSHLYGPGSRQAREYLAWLDTRMAKLLATLAAPDQIDHSNQSNQSNQSNHSDQGPHRVVSVLTADHGFVETKHRVRLGKLLNRSDLGLVALNEGRFLALHLPPKRSPKELERLLVKAQKVPGVELTAQRDGASLLISSGQQRFRFAIGPAVCEGEPISLSLQPERENGLVPASADFRCPSDFDQITSRFPFLVADLSRYLNAPNHPDAVLLAKTDSSFAGGMKGSHGGPTAEEMFVPILLRNASLTGEGPTRTSDLLKMLHRRD